MGSKVAQLTTAGGIALSTQGNNLRTAANKLQTLTYNNTVMPMVRAANQMAGRIAPGESARTLAARTNAQVQTAATSPIGQKAMGVVQGMIDAGGATSEAPLSDDPWYLGGYAVASGVKALLGL